MRLYSILPAFALALVLTSCSDSAPVAKTAPKKEAVPEPISGRQAIQYMGGSARVWASDAQPLTVRSLQVDGVKKEAGKAGAWEVMFVSENSGGARPYTWSAVELEEIHLRKGVFPGPPETWRVEGATQPFSSAEIRIDSEGALAAAVAASAVYLKKPGTKPEVNYFLEHNKVERYQNPVWRVMWGRSVSSAEYVVTVDAITGMVLAK